MVSAYRLDTLGRESWSSVPCRPQNFSEKVLALGVRLHIHSSVIYLKHACSLQFLPQLPEQSFDCAILDPPYGQTSLSWDKQIPNYLPLIRRILKKTGSIWFFGSLRSILKTDFTGWRMSHDVVWEKHNGAGFFNDRFRTVHELVAHFYRDDSPWSSVFKNPQYTMDARARTVRKKAMPAHWVGARGAYVYTSEDGGPRLARSVQYVRSEHGRAVHPTQKPEALLELLLRYACPVGGYVLDPFAGSGSTGLVAERCGMNSVLFEADARYHAIIAQRIGKAS